MTDKPAGRAHGDPALAPPVEGSIEAPVVYFEGVPTFGAGSGVGSLTLEMTVYDPTEPGAPTRARRRVVAHLRGPLTAFEALRAAIDQMAAMLSPPAGTKPN